MIENNFTADEYQIIDITSFIKKVEKNNITNLNSCFNKSRLK